MEVLVKKFLVLLIALGVAGAIAYLVFSRAREADPGGAEPEIDLRDTAGDETTEFDRQVADTVGTPH